MAVRAYRDEVIGVVCSHLQLLGLSVKEAKVQKLDSNPVP